MRLCVAAFGLAFLLAGQMSLPALSTAHPGNVIKSDCTHVDRRTGERHRHTGRPYCGSVFLTDAGFHH